VKELARAQKLGHFSSILGFEASRVNIFHSRSKPSEWDPCPIHLGIQTPSQYQAMFTFAHNGMISMGATFGGNIICSP
jgi:hypothetical protein